MDALALHRLQFAFTITFHYLFPQLTMGLSLLIVVMKSIGLKPGREDYNDAARFWGRIFGVNFVMGVVTGIPMEFQFGTNWSQFAQVTGGIIGQPLAMEGVFSFFLESAFLGLFLFGERRLSRLGHWWAAFLVFLGSWISGFFIIVADAWMQHPVAYHFLPNGDFALTSFAGLLLNPWAWIEYAHNMSGAVITGAFAMAATGAFYVLEERFAQQGRIFLKVGVSAGLIASILQVFPTGDLHGRYMAHHQAATVAGMEALFKSEKGAPLVIIGQPNVETQTIDNPIILNRVLSFLVYGTLSAEVDGLDHFPSDHWPTNIPLLYYAYHIMVGLGTWFLFVMSLAALLLWRGKLFETRGALWLILLSFPLPFIANTAGWITAEAGRQPWLVYGLLRTTAGSSRTVSAGNTLFTLLGFLGLYAMLAILFIFLIYREIDRGPEARLDTSINSPDPTTAGTGEAVR